MRATLESTSKIVQLEVALGGGFVGMPARIWEGKTEAGIPFHAYIVRVAVDNDQDSSQFDRELKETKAPTAAIEAIPLRLIL